MPTRNTEPLPVPGRIVLESGPFRAASGTHVTLNADPADLVTMTANLAPSPALPSGGTVTLTFAGGRFRAFAAQVAAQDRKAARLMARVRSVA